MSSLPGASRVVALPDLPRMVAIDMDGTLVHPDGGVSTANRAALRRARECGAQIVIATGRRHSYAMKILRTLPLDGSDIVLSSNGTVARTAGGTLLFRRPMPLDTARWLCTAVGEFRGSFVLTFDIAGVNGDEEEAGTLVLEQMDELHSSIGKWMETNARSIRRVEPIHDSLLGGELPIQAMLCGTVERMRQAEGLLESENNGRLELFRTEYPARDLCILDILPQGCSKGSGLAMLLQAAGLSADGLMCLGDNWNDLPMLEMARWPVLMGNAPPALRAVAVERGWTVAGRHDEDAVAVAIQTQFASAR